MARCSTNTKDSYLVVLYIIIEVVVKREMLHKSLVQQFDLLLEQCLEMEQLTLPLRLLLPLP